MATVKTDNRTIGGKFEQELSHLLADAGFWVHVFQQNKSGQPSDIIAVKGKYHTLIDCKVISDNKGFPFSRIEENQRLAMERFLKRAGEHCWFALKLPDGSVWMLNQNRVWWIKRNGGTGISDKEIREKLWPLDSWLKESDEWGKDI